MDELDNIDVRLLPPQMRFLVEIIGLPETIVLLKNKGGMLLQIPKGERDVESYDLYEILSAESIQKLCASRFADERVTLPKVDKILDQIRNIEIRNSKPTTTRAQLAKKYNLSFRQIQRLWNTAVDNSNLDLFDD
jgi:hypothetical protein